MQSREPCPNELQSGTLIPEWLKTHRPEDTINGVTYVGVGKGTLGLDWIILDINRLYEAIRSTR